MKSRVFVPVCCLKILASNRPSTVSSSKMAAVTVDAGRLSSCFPALISSVKACRRRQKSIASWYLGFDLAFACIEHAGARRRPTINRSEVSGPEGYSKASIL